jgi:nucleoside 2-deoxyribosyltransferase
MWNSSPSLAARQALQDPAARRTVYIAGPMSGYSDDNRVAFEAAQAVWAEAGFRVLSPFDLNDVIWREVFGVNRDHIATSGALAYTDPLTACIIGDDLVAVCMADCIALLPGIERSTGAKPEMLVAQMLGKPFYDAMTMTPLNVALSVQVAISPGAGAIPKPFVPA